MINLGVYMQTESELNEVFKKTAGQIIKPIKQDDLEFLLIENGLQQELKKGVIKKNLAEFGVIKKLIMIEGLREYYWTSNNGENTMATKIRFYKWLWEFLQGKEQIEAKELLTFVKANKFDADLLNKHFFDGDGTPRNWRGWVLVKYQEGKYYKKLHSEGENSD